MFIYLFIIILSFLLAFLNLDKSMINSKKNVYYSSLFMSLILIVVAAVRYETGYDFFLYRDSFESIPSLFEIFSKDLFSNSNFEWGYTIFSFFSKSVLNSFQFLLFCFSVVNIFLLQRIVLRRSPYPLISIFIYICFFYFFMLMGQMRQGLSMVILYYSYQFIINNNFKKFLVTVLIASSFHISSLIFLPAYFIVRKRIRTSMLIIAFAAIFLINDFLIEYLVDWVEKMYLSNPSSFVLYRFYVYSVHYVGDFSPMAYYEKIVLAIIIIALYNNKRILKTIPDYHIISNIILLGIFIYMIMIQTFTVIGARGANNLLSFSVFLYPMFLKSTKSVFIKYLIFGAITIYPMIRCLMKLYSEESYMHFKTFFVQFF